MNYIITNPSGEKWSDEDGWVDNDSFSTYSEAEKRAFKIPLGGTWEPLPERTGEFEALIKRATDRGHDDSMQEKIEASWQLNLAIGEALEKNQADLTTEEIFKSLAIACGLLIRKNTEGAERANYRLALVLNLINFNNIITEVALRKKENHK